MIKVAFASTNQTHVDTHFGAAQRFVIYDVSPGEAELVAVGEFVPVVMKGENKNRSLPAGTMLVPGEEMMPTAEEMAKPPEDKVVVKLEFLAGCAAVYAASIGTSSIKRLMAAEIQPIIVGNGHEIHDLLNEVSLALHCGGLSWVTRAVARAQAKSPERFDAMEEEGWQGNAVTAEKRVTHQLITSIDDLD